MKIELIGGAARVTSESNNEAISLFTRYGVSEVKEHREVKKHKKHLFVKECAFCGKSV